MADADAPELGGGAATDQTLGVRETGWGGGERSEVVSTADDFRVCDVLH